MKETDNKTLHDEIWNKLQHHDEAYVHEFLQESLRKVGSHTAGNRVSDFLMELLRAPLFLGTLLAIIIGIPAVLFLITWILGMAD
ncbi:hypothetical protein [Paenibacillus alba]|uniref:Uncharacterized protein n=1 Tax=Paenibacillus alba TaxID=1197127 RepID=A0ABU6G2R1_9BACL|nr:hypothetical protein [Paenibacillus alba]MEC0228458.1 hypothetical protein [Paenibacillus alba]NQX70186.1 hypothetical protein [Paenibacillus alba]